MSFALIQEYSDTYQEVPGMTMFAAYLLERVNVELIENDKGFAIYVITGTESYIRDIWVKKEFRKQGVASSLADLVAEKAIEAGCSILSGSVCPTTKGADDSIRVLQAYGMRVHSATNNLIVFIKDLESKGN